MFEPSDTTLPEIVRDEETWVAYDPPTGTTTTGRLAPNGVASPLAQLMLDRNWIFIMPTVNGMTLFIPPAYDHVSTGVFADDGTFTDLVTSPLNGNFHRITPLFGGLVMWNRSVSENGQYRSVSVIGRVHPDGRHEFISEQHLLDFWTHIVHVGDGRILFYNATSHEAATGVVTPEGGFVNLAGNFPLDPWTTILSTGDGKVLFHNQPTGQFATGRVGADGSFTDLHSQFLGQMGFVPTTRNRYLIFRSADTLVARLDDGGVFRDTVIVRGLPTGRRITFVR
jgi:hypothetical protein